MMMYKQELKNRLMNLSSWLFVFYSFVLGTTVELSFSIPVVLFTTKEDNTVHSCFHPVPDTVIDQTYLFIFQSSLFCLMFPFAGWVSDSIIGRSESLGLSIWLCWFGALLQCISICVQYGTCGFWVNIAKYGISGLAYVFLMVGNAGLFTNIPTYGIDQLFDKPHIQSRAYIYWTVWGLYLGFAPAYIAFVDKIVYFPILFQITGLAVFIVSSIALCLHICFQNCYQTVQRSSKDPYKISCQILKYAWHNSKPANRSAFTYWEDEIPSRLDIAKSRYGGPFTVQDVEDTKTLVRIIVVVLSTIGFFIPYYHSLIGVLNYVDQFHDATLVNGFASFILWKLSDSTIVIIVPVLQLIILPLFPKIEYFLGNPLRGFTICFFFQITALIPMAFLELLRHSRPDTISFLYFSIPLLFSGLADSLSLIFGLEFICSQAPSRMRGLLTGLYWLIRNLYVDMGALFVFVHFKNLYQVSSAFWILIIQILICVIGVIFFTVVVKWYTERKRNDIYNIQEQVESIYNRNFLQAEILEGRNMHYNSISISNSNNTVNNNL